MIRTIIVEDEAKARETINAMLKLYCPDVEVIGEYASVSGAWESIPTQQPELVLLDIQLEDGTGFDLLQKLPAVNFKVIFITAFEEYAVQAFKASAVDYLLKPLDPDDLVNGVAKAREAIDKEQTQMQLKALLANLNKQNEDKKLVLKTTESIHLVDVQNIIRCEAHRNYTQFYLAENKKLLVSKTLKEFDEVLTSYNFFRVHQSHLINMRYFERFDKTDGGFVIMKDGSEVPVSHRRKEAFLRFMEGQ